MNHIKSLFRTNEENSLKADEIIQVMKNASNEQKITLLRVIHSARNKGEIRIDESDQLIKEASAKLESVKNNHALQFDSVCKITFQKVRATVPTYLEKKFQRIISSTRPIPCRKN